MSLQMSLPIQIAETAAVDSFSAMTAEQAALYERLQNFSIDVEDSPLAFSQRLARENVWSPDFASQVIEEYKRFVFLAITASHPVTPSDQVDQVWHLHLAYTHSYWDEFCPQVLQTSLHHEPTKGGAAEGDKFKDWYEQTLASYEHFFEAAPPADIWPTAELRFSRDIEFERINTRQHWIIPKLPISREIFGGVISALTFALCYLFFVEYGGAANSIGGLMVTVIGAIASYSLIQLGAGLLEALHRPNQGYDWSSDGGGCGFGGCGGCGGCGGGGCGG